METLLTLYILVGIATFFRFLIFYEDPRTAIVTAVTWPILFSIYFIKETVRQIIYCIKD